MDHPVAMSGDGMIVGAYVVETVAPSAPALVGVDSARGLAALLGLSYQRELSFALHRLPASRRYSAFEIPKKSGGTRLIHKPIRLLMRIQDLLLPHLQELYKPPPCVHGHVIGRSTKTNALEHVDRRFVVNLDIENFFDSIHFRRVESILQSSRYGLCPEVARTIAQICCHEGTLPMGAPTSGILSNIVCGPLDAILLRLAKRHHLRYTRYVDDLTFSASNPAALREGLGINLEGTFIARDIDALSEEARLIFLREGFPLNPSKIWIVTRQVRQQVTGLVVNRKINVPRVFFRNLRASVHAAERHGIELAQEFYEQKYRGGGSSSLKKNILGRLSYLGYMTEYDRRYSKLADRVQKLFSESSILDPYRSREKSVYFATVLPDESEGTAFHIGDGLFLTAAHLFGPEDIPSAKLQCPEHFPTPFVAPIVHIDREIDVAILRAPTTIGEEKRPHILLGNRRTYVGDKVEALGFPQYNQGNSCSYIETKITARRSHGAVTRMEVDRPLPHGASGGPVFDSYGAFAGLVYSGAARGSHDAPLATSFTPSSAIDEVVSAWRERLPPPPASTDPMTSE